jgi:hypothetical protein
VAQVFALVLLFLAWVRPRTWKDAAIVPLALAALLGIHTFEGAIMEAFPVNTFLTILLCCLAAANLAFAAPRWWVDVAAALLFVVAALTVESGLLVWVIVVGAALVGARGVSRAGLGALTVLLAGYFVLRFAVLDVGAPDLLERSSGFGFRVLDTGELVARFGDAPWVFYAYNVVTSFLSVLVGEPRGGVFRLVRGLTTGSVPPALVVSVAASTLGTALVAAYVWQRRTAWLGRRFTRDDQVVALFLIVLAANAVISYPYTKDVIMSPAGVFYAAALFAAARGLTLGGIGGRGALASAMAAVFCLGLGTAWAVRDVGMHLNLRLSALRAGNDWGYADDQFARQERVLEGEDLRLFRQLQHDALIAHPPPPQLWLQELRLFDVN